MRRLGAPLGVLLGMVLLANCHKEPIGTADTLPNPAPSTGEVWLEFRGLVSFVFRQNGGVQSVFLSPNGFPHPPLVAVNTGDLEDDSVSEPDWVTAGPGDTGLAAWRFTEASVDRSNVKETSLKFYPDALNLSAPDYSLIRWVPSMGDIFQGTQDVDSATIAAAAARGSWGEGEMTPIFDAASHKDDPWNIGERKKTAVADGIRLKLTLTNPKLPLTLRLTRDSTAETILIRGGAIVRLTAYPRDVPSRDEDMTHFHHFYDLRKTDKSGPHPTRLKPPTPYPARCAPSIFYPPLP